MTRDAASGALLIAGAAAGVVVMGLHPTSHGLMNADSGRHLTQVNVLVHGLALAAVPMIFLGLLGLCRRRSEWVRRPGSDRAPRAVRLADLGRRLAVPRQARVSHSAKRSQ